MRALGTSICNDMKYVANFRASLTNISSSSAVRREFFLSMRFCVGEQPDWVAKAAPYLFVPREGARARVTLTLASSFNAFVVAVALHACQIFNRRSYNKTWSCLQFAMIGGRKSYCTAQRLKHHHCYDCQFPSDKTKSAGCQLFNQVSAVSLS